MVIFKGVMNQKIWTLYLKYLSPRAWYMPWPLNYSYSHVCSRPLLNSVPRPIYCSVFFALTWFRCSLFVIGCTRSLHSTQALPCHSWPLTVWELHSFRCTHTHTHTHTHIYTHARTHTPPKPHSIPVSLACPVSRPQPVRLEPSSALYSFLRLYSPSLSKPK